MTPERRHEISRLEAFSDAAFAFALTLLVVSLDVPKSYEELTRIMRGFPSFACCFALLVWIWHEHNAFFRRYGLQDGWTVVLNGILLFVTLFYVYPLKFMFDSMFLAMNAVRGLEPMTLHQLSRASAMYATGFVALFAVFTLLYRHAYNRRRELELTPLEVLDVKIFAGHHVVSAGVGLVSLAVALLAPLPLVPLAPPMFALMGPAHWLFGVRSERWRRTLRQTLAARPASAAT
jgi:uncharacterized membrane protein